MRLAGLVLFVFSAVFLLPAQADEKLKGIACRSVHLAYPGPDATVFYNEVKVEKSADGTYFCACGFNKGYFGMQELANGKKLVIFSVWDPGSQSDPKKVDPEKQVKMLHKDAAVRVGRFGNEGTGGQSFFDYDWKVGETYRFCVAAHAKGPRTAYSGYFHLPETKEWKHLVTFSTLAEGKSLRGYYAFIEDFRRNKVSTTKTRVAEFSNTGVRTADGKWQPLETARFTADSNSVLNINAGLKEGQFYLMTGGDIKNDATPLREKMTRPRTAMPSLPEIKEYVP